MIKEFTLGAVKWEVEIDNSRMDDARSYGLCVPERSMIYLQDEKRKEDMVDQTLYHEAIHAILDTMGEYELSANEKFVQNFSVLLHQFDKTKK